MVTAYHTMTPLPYNLFLLYYSDSMAIVTLHYGLNYQMTRYFLIIITELLIPCVCYIQ